MLHSFICAIRNKNHVYMRLALCAIALFACVSLCACSTHAGGSDTSRYSPSTDESLYSFPEAGFEASFPDEPKSGMGRGMYQESEPGYVAYKGTAVTNVSIAQAPDGFAVNANKGGDEKIIKMDLDMQIYTHIDWLGIKGVDLKSGIEYFDFNKDSNFSGWAAFEGYLDFSESGGDPRTHLHMCCGLIAGHDWLYSVFIARDTKEQALAAARSFNLIDLSANRTIVPGNREESADPSGAISWTEAAQHVGETVTICGPVADTEYAETSEGSPTFIDLGAPYPDKSRVTIVVWGKDRESFPYPPETIPVGWTVYVTGEVYLYDGVCNIEVTSPSQIEKSLMSPQE